MADDEIVTGLAERSTHLWLLQGLLEYIEGSLFQFLHVQHEVLEVLVVDDVLEDLAV